MGYANFVQLRGKKMYIYIFQYDKNKHIKETFKMAIPGGLNIHVLLKTKLEAGLWVF